MIRILLLGLSLLAVQAATAQPARPLYANLEGEALFQAVQLAYQPKELLGYGPARDLMYGQIDNFRDSVTCVYSGHRLYVPPNVDPSQALYRDGSSDGINCEHVWPRSKGAKYGNPKSDMHHLFPTRVAVNAARGNAPLRKYPMRKRSIGTTRQQNNGQYPSSRSMPTASPPATASSHGKTVRGILPGPCFISIPFTGGRHCRPIPCFSKSSGLHFWNGTGRTQPTSGNWRGPEPSPAIRMASLTPL